MNRKGTQKMNRTKTSQEVRCKYLVISRIGYWLSRGVATVALSLMAVLVVFGFWDMTTMNGKYSPTFLLPLTALLITISVVSMIYAKPKRYWKPRFLSKRDFYLAVGCKIFVIVQLIWFLQHPLSKLMQTQKDLLLWGELMGIALVLWGIAELTSWRCRRIEKGCLSVLIFDCKDYGLLND